MWVKRSIFGFFLEGSQIETPQQYPLRFQVFEESEEGALPDDEMLPSSDMDYSTPRIFDHNLADPVGHDFLSFLIILIRSTRLQTRGLSPIEQKILSVLVLALDRFFEGCGFTGDDLF